MSITWGLTGSVLHTDYCYGTVYVLVSTIPGYSGHDILSSSYGDSDYCYGTVYRSALYLGTPAMIFSVLYAETQTIVMAQCTGQHYTWVLRP